MKSCSKIMTICRLVATLDSSSTREIISHGVVRFTVYTACISCDAEFNWRVQFIGQEDCEGNKDGEAIWKLVKKTFVDQGFADIWEKLECVGTDGDSTMRSTPKYSGLDCNGTNGRAFSAHFKRDVGELVDFWHCLCHILNLSLNDALGLVIALKLYYLPHLRMCHAEFKKSSNNRRDLKFFLEELKQIDRNFDWRIFYPVLCCFTRWLGLQLCAYILARKSNRALMQKYVQGLRDKGYGSRAFDPYKYRRRRGIQAAQDGGGDDRAGDDTDDSEDEEAARVRAGVADGRLEQDDDFVREPRLYRSVQTAADAAPSQEDLVQADGFDCGAEGASRYLRKNLLNPDVGLTDLNCGRSCYLSGVLKPYKVLVESLQRVTTPEQHLAARRFRQFYMVMQKAWIGSETSEPMFACQAFQEWMEEMEGKNKSALVRLVKQECRSFASIFVSVLRSRLRDY